MSCRLIFADIVNPSLFVTGVTAKSLDKPDITPVVLYSRMSRAVTDQRTFLVLIR